MHLAPVGRSFIIVLSKVVKLHEEHSTNPSCQGKSMLHFTELGQTVLV